MQWVIKFNGLSGDIGQRGPYNPYFKIDNQHGRPIFNMNVGLYEISIYWNYTDIL